MSTIQSTVPTKTFTAIALDAELGRRRNNKTRPKGSKVRAKSYIFPELSGSDIAEIKAGGTVTVVFGTGRVEVVGLAA